MSLPAELRHQIYNLALTKEGNVYIRPRKRRHQRKPPRYDFLSRVSLEIPKHEIRPWQEPALLQVSTGIRDEASAMYYKSNSFEVTIQPNEFGLATSWLRSIIARCGLSPVWGVCFLSLHRFVERSRQPTKSSTILPRSGCSAFTRVVKVAIRRLYLYIPIFPSVA